MADTSLEKAKLLSVLKHDMNNVLTGVKTGLEIMAMDEFFEDEDNAGDLNDVKKASVRMANMLEDLSLLFGDEPSLAPPAKGVGLLDLKTRIANQLELENIPLLSQIEPSETTQITVHPESLVRAIFYGALLLNEIEKGGVTLRVKASGSSSSWTFALSPTLRQKLESFLRAEGGEGRPSFLLKMGRLASLRIGGGWSLNGEGWKLQVERNP